MEVDLESEEPTETGDDMSSSKDDGDRGIAMTLVERRKPTATPVGDGRGTKVRGNVPKLRMHAASEDAALEREAKRAWSSCPSEVSSASRPPAPSVVEHTNRSGGHDHSLASLGSTRVRDP